MLQQSTVKFLKDLKKNNNKPWFDQNRKAYEAAKTDFLQFIQAVINQHGKKDLSIKHLIAKDCIFRINRDIRFSKDKTPYKSNFGASINKDGRKAMGAAGYYFHFDPEESFAGGGIYMPMPDELKKVRQEIDYNFAEFKKVINAKKFKTVYGDLDRNDSLLLTRVPKGYQPDNPAADYLRLKSYIAMVKISSKDLTAKDLVKNTADAFASLQPFIEFINRSLS